MNIVDWREEFNDIRPYSDEELHGVLRRLVQNKWLIAGVQKLRIPWCPRVLRPFAHRFIRFDLWRSLRRIGSVDEFQRRIIVDRVLEFVVKKTSNGLSWSGSEHLERGGAYLYMSNHRDIVLDSALLNYSLAHSDLDIAEIAFGDNLLANDFVSDLIRVNKSFIVQRSLPGRERARAAHKLSRYIKLTQQHGNPVWIAQREGRAKDGSDITNPAILKMLYIEARRGGTQFHDFLRQARIVPVSVSYEFDPCDRYKARELLRTRLNGTYEKRKSEDLISMYMGLKGNKGRIHFSFGEPLKCDHCDHKGAASEIDRRIHSLYRLWPSNYIAYDIFHGTSLFRHKYTDEQVVEFTDRYRKEPEAVGRLVCEIYAKPVSNSIRANETIDANTTS